MNRGGFEPPHLSIRECTRRLNRPEVLETLESRALDRSAIYPFLDSLCLYFYLLIINKQIEIIFAGPATRKGTKCQIRPSRQTTTRAAILDTKARKQRGAKAVEQPERKQKDVPKPSLKPSSNEVNYPSGEKSLDSGRSDGVKMDRKSQKHTTVGIR